ncbi:MAG: SCO family protein [Proteobacteria bacterium]|nr:SCO family protein [Pseudomonadota bacterium]
MPKRSLVILLVLAVAVAGLFAGLAVFGDRAAPPVQTRAVQLFPQPRAIPAFSLQRGDGSALTADTLRGHWTLVFIGFTHCPDVCPTTLALLSSAQKQWRALPEASRPRLLFVSVDPGRDTPRQVEAYAHGFDPDTLAATADLKPLEAFTHSLSMVFMRSEPPAGAPANTYSVDHSAAIVVLDPQVRMAGTITPPFDPQAIAADMTALSQAKSR